MKILLYPDSHLTTVCKEVIDLEEANKILAEMEEVMKATPNAIGLSANQIGYDKRICMMRDGETFIKMINPVAEQDDTAQTFYKKEMCLSLPGVAVALHAPEDLVVQYKNENGEEIRKNFDTELMARCALHEINHINGKTILERTNSIQRSAIRSKYYKFMDRQYSKFRKTP